MSIDLPVLENAPIPEPPSSLVVRFGRMGNIGEFPYDGGRLGCATKVVLRSRRGTELATVLTTTCSNSTCAVSITRERLTSYIQESGGNDYPFSTEGRILRIATAEDLEQQSRIDATKPQYVSACRELIRELELPMKLADVELLLGGEMATFFFMSEHRVDFRTLVKHLASRFHTRIQMHQVGARDEARLVADFETCGHECCCRRFLKVLRPVNMGSAKMQKATLDPNKISGRCGRLKCCLRYEEQSYEELRKKLPRVGTRVLVKDGVGVVEETAILTQLVKIRLEDGDRIIAVANEEILERNVVGAAAPRPKPAERSTEFRSREQGKADQPAESQQGSPAAGRRSRGAGQASSGAPRSERPAENTEKQRQGSKTREGRPGRRDRSQPRPAATESANHPSGNEAAIDASEPPSSIPAPPSSQAAPAAGDSDSTAGGTAQTSASSAPVTPPAAGSEPGSAAPGTPNQAGGASGIGALGRRRRRGRSRDGR